MVDIWAVTCTFTELLCQHNKTKAHSACQRVPPKCLAAPLSQTIRQNMHPSQVLTFHMICPNLPLFTCSLTERQLCKSLAHGTPSRSPGAGEPAQTKDLPHCPPFLSPKPILALPVGLRFQDLTRAKHRGRRELPPWFYIFVVWRPWKGHR